MSSQTPPEPITHTGSPEPANQGNGLAITSLVLGILSLTGFFFLTGVPAIITGIMSLRKKQQERGMSIAGIIMGSIGTFISLLAVLAVILLIIIGMADNSSNTMGDPLFDSYIEDAPIESSRT